MKCLGLLLATVLFLNVNCSLRDRAHPVGSNIWYGWAGRDRVRRIELCEQDLGGGDWSQVVGIPQTCPAQQRQR